MNPTDSAEPARRSAHDVVCRGCGCLCDDVTIELVGDRVGRLEPACELGSAWFAEIGPAPRPLCRVDGHEVGLDEAIAAAAELLGASGYPLLDGVDRLGSESQRLLIDLAASLGGIVRSEGSGDDRWLAQRRSGDAELGWTELRGAAEAVVLWKVDPMRTHPRFVERMLPTAESGGPAKRTVVAIHDGDPPTTDIAERSVLVPSGRDFAALWALRGLLAGVPMDPERLARQCGVDPEELARLADLLGSANGGAIVLPPLGTEPGIDEPAGLLAADLARRGRFGVARLGRPENAAGATHAMLRRNGVADEALPAESAGAESVGLGRILRRQTIDAALLCRADPIGREDPEVWQRLGRIPMVVLDWADTVTAEAASVSIAVAAEGIDADASWTREDGVVLPARAFRGSPCPSLVSVLEAIATRIAQRTTREAS